MTQTAPNPDQENIRLYKRFGARGLFIPILLTISLVFNILALSIPFLELRLPFSGETIYDLPRSVILMWQGGLYLISILILGFSIIFPLLKLVGMFTAWFVPKSFVKQERILGLVKNLGKWSFMDILVVSLLLALTNDQAAISSTPRIGVYFFILAIIISMTTSEILHSMMMRLGLSIGHIKPMKEPDRLTCPLLTLHWRGWFIGTMLIVAILAFFATVGFPFLRINQFFLSSLSYNILGMLEAVSQQHQPIISIVLLLCLVVLPFLRILGAIILWFGLFRERTRAPFYRWLGRVARWSMLDVLGLALFMVLTEGQRMIKTDIRSGLYFLMISIILAVVLPLIAARMDTPRRKSAP